MVTTKTAMGEEQFKLYQEKEYPDPRSLTTTTHLHMNQNLKLLWQTLQLNHMLKLWAERYISRQLNAKMNWEPR